jgi:hypothetical protein
VILPSIDSPAWVSSFAIVVSSVAGLYGSGLLFSTIGCDAGPDAFWRRPITRPVIGEPFACFAIGATT